MKVLQHNTAWLNNSCKGRVAVGRSHSLFSFVQRSQHLSSQANLRCVWGSQVPALPSSWQIMFLISVSVLADGWCWSYRVLTLISAPIAQSSSTVAHQRFRTRSNFSHNIVFMVRCSMLGFIWYNYLYKQVAHFRWFSEKNAKYFVWICYVKHEAIWRSKVVQNIRKIASSYWFYLTLD